MFGIFMEQRTVIRFLTLNGLHVSGIAAELKLVSEAEACAISRVSKWPKRFAEGGTSLYGDLKCEKFLINDSAEAISSMLKDRPYLSCKVLCRRFRIAKRTCLQILHDTPSMKKGHFRSVFRALDTN
jgi:hypothetical protein